MPDLFLYDNQRTSSADVTLRGARRVSSGKVGRVRPRHRAGGPGPWMSPLPAAVRPVEVSLYVSVSASAAVGASAGVTVPTSVSVASAVRLGRSFVPVCVSVDVAPRVCSPVLVAAGAVARTDEVSALLLLAAVRTRRKARL